MDCLNTLIGLSKTTCSCYDPLPIGYNTSDSGRFIDEIQGFNLDVLGNKNDCKDGSIWDILEKARSQAIVSLSDDLSRCLGSSTDSIYESCKGFLIGQKLDGTSSTSDYIGIRITPEYKESTYLNVSKFGLLVTNSGTIDWFIYSNQDFSTPLLNGTQAVIPNSINSFDAEISLDLYGENCLELEYYFVIKKNGVTTKSNKIHCQGCTGKRACNIPFYCQVGINGNDLNTIESWTKQGNYANGIVYSGEVTCEVEICDYLVSKKNSLYAYIATALQLKSAEYAYLKVLNSSSFDRYTTLNSDQLKASLNDWSNLYKEAIGYICQEIAKQGHPCLKCDSPIKRHLIRG